MALPAHLEDIRQQIERYAHEFGLDFYDVIFECVSFDEMNMVAAFGGFPTRYPHWKFGMEYEQLSKSYTYGLSKIYELVINNDPSYAYLMASNADVDQKLVMAHVYGHVDFFKNNFSFAHTNRKMMDTMANHGTKIRRYIDRYGLEKVETFIERCLSLDNLIDRHAPYIKRHDEKKEKPERDLEIVEVPKLKADREYMQRYINPDEFLAEQRRRLEAERERERKFPERPERDVLLFLVENAPLENWERDVLSMLRDEAYYFSPQGQTKIMNEGWACVEADTLVFTASGLMPMADLVRSIGVGVSDGDARRAVYDRNIIRDHETVRIQTRRGLVLSGSTNHRVMMADGAWRRLDQLHEGDRVRVSGGAGLWPHQEVPLSWQPHHRVTLEEVAVSAGVSLSTVLRHRDGRQTRTAAALALALEAYDAPLNQALPQAVGKRAAVRVPERVDARLGAFAGYLVGDGHISRKKRQLGLTTGDLPQAEAFAALAVDLFGVRPVIKRDGGRWRVLVSSETIADLLQEALGMCSGPSAPRKRVPSVILRSPEPVVRAFLRAYFDCDGHAGEQGVILSTTSEMLGRQVQLLLLNYGILSRRRRQSDGGWHLHVAGDSARRFAASVGFGLARKQAALDTYVRAHQWFKAEEWEDEVVEISTARADVYDISVEETHRYAAAGFVNHNSFWHTTIMTQRALEDSEVIDYADRHSGTMGTQPGSINPYKLGLELYRDIEERWNKGRFGKEWEECDSLADRKAWDRAMGLGRQKIFEVRRHYNDVTFIDEFLTPDFIREHKLFTYGYNKKTGNWEITDREARAVKEKLLLQLTNLGQPFISVINGNYENRGELLLKHNHEGVDLRQDYMRDTLANLFHLWSRPVAIVTRIEGRMVLVRFDGQDYRETDIETEL